MVTQMDVRDAVRTAKDYIKAMYADEKISSVGLEEVKFETTGMADTWDVTIGFFRSFADAPFTQLAAALQNDPRRRVYKIVRINATDGRVVAMLHRAVGDER